MHTQLKQLLHRWCTGPYIVSDLVLCLSKTSENKSIRASPQNLMHNFIIVTLLINEVHSKRLCSPKTSFINQTWGNTLVCYPFLSNFFANSLRSNFCLNARYLSKLVPAHCWQKHSSVGTNELRGNGPLGAFFRETKNRCRGRILWSKDKLRYVGYLVKECTSLRSSLIKYMYLGFKLSSNDKDSTCRYSKWVDDRHLGHREYQLVQQIN